jgi:hypothetical protein
VSSDPRSSTNRCADPDGPTHPVTQISEAEALILGKWRLCVDRPDETNEAGLEFISDGTYRALVDDGHGGLVQRTGFGATGDWVVEQATSSTALIGWWIPGQITSTRGGWGTFEDDPRKVAFAIQDDPDLVIYVWVGPSVP